MEWLLLAVFCIMWGAFLLPARARRSERRTVQDHERRMELLAYSEVHHTTGRWIITPRKGVRFLGPHDRHRARARERRRRIFLVLIEAVILTLLIGLVPPLRVAWWVSGALGVLLLLYVWLLLTIKARTPQPSERARAARVPERAVAPNPRFVAEGPMNVARPRVNGLGSLGEGDRVHVVVKTASASA